MGFSNSIAQTYPLESIPTELKQNAYAVIQKAETQVELHSLNKVVQTRTRVITVLEKADDDIAQPVQFYSPSLKINELEAIYYDQNGKQIKKFKEQDFMDYSYIANGQLYTDDRVKFLNFTPCSYPYTVYFKSVVTSSNTTLGNWFPVIDYNVSILHSTYTIHNKSNLKILSKELNLKEYGIQSQNPNQSSIRYELKNFTAIEEEDLAPRPYELLPIVILSTNEFVRDGIKGSFTNWKELGLWYNELIKGTMKENSLTNTSMSSIKTTINANLAADGTISGNFMEVKDEYFAMNDRMKKQKDS